MKHLNANEPIIPAANDHYAEHRIDMLLEENARLQKFILALAERVLGQAECLGRVAMTNHMKNRVVVWFSCGAASAVATKLILSEYPKDNVVVAYCYVVNEHLDNLRFLKDCELWFNHPITILQSDKYKDIYDVFKKQKYLVSPYGAPCTLHLKKRLRQQFEEPGDLQAFGYTIEEQSRAERFRQHNPDVQLLTPLIEAGLTKADCLGMLQRANIQLPAMYHLGYQNNNCIGCVKGGMGYWNKIRVDFPDVFERMAKLERKLENTVLRDNGLPLYLDELEPDRGNYPVEPNIECSLMCHFAEERIIANHQQKKDV